MVPEQRPLCAYTFFKSLCLAKIVPNTSYFEGANQISRLKAEQEAWKGKWIIYSPVQSTKPWSLLCLHWLCWASVNRRGEGRRERESTTLSCFKVSSFDFTILVNFPWYSPLSTYIGPQAKRRRRDGGRGVQGGEETWESKGRKRRNERITAKLEGDGLRGNCGGGRITFRSRGRELSRLLWQLCSPAQPLASCLPSFQWQE